MRAGRRTHKQRAPRPRQEGVRSVGSPSLSRDSTLEGTELPELPRSMRESEDQPDLDDGTECADAVASSASGTTPIPASSVPSVPTSSASTIPLPSYDLSAAQREHEMEAKQQEARALAEERRAMLEKQEMLKRQQEDTQKRRIRRERRNRKKRVDSVEKSNKGPGSESDVDESKPQSDGSDYSFEDSTEEENPFELCYSPDRTKPTSPFRDASGYHKPDISGYQCQEKEDRKVLIEDNYKGVENWERGQGGITSCWSGVVSQLCGSSTHIWLNLPLVSMFAYDPVPDAEPR